MGRVLRGGTGVAAVAGVLGIILLLNSVVWAAGESLRIISATWGAGARRVDVKSPLQSMVKDGGLQLSVGAQALGDPIFGTKKELVIVYEFNGVRKTERYSEGDRIALGVRPAIVGDSRVSQAEVAKLHALAQNATDVHPTAAGVEIVKDGVIRTREQLAVPVRIDVTAVTDSTNIRLFFGDKGIVIFNWEMNQDELRYHTPGSGQLIALGGKGRVPVNTWVHITWIVEPTRATILVDGQPRLITDGNYAGLSGAAGVGGHDAKLQVTQLDFVQLAPNSNGTGLAAVPPKRATPTPVVPEPVDVPGVATPIKKQQSEIKALYVREQESGEMLGLASELILTATPGSPRGYTPVRFASEVGDQMSAVLDDVLRSIRIKYPKWAASKVELSFEDRYTPKDGGSIGAAIGTLILSMIQGFDIDQKMAMTGDVTADGKLRRIGGVAAKIRGATAAGCNFIVVPAENYDQVVDAMVYEGPALITDLQVIGASTLDEATAVARADRGEKLSQALDAFGSLAPILKKSPERVHTKDVQDKLKRILDLAPDHFSAKLLLLVAQNKQPRKLSATASMYYMIVAMDKTLPTLFDQAESGRPQRLTPAVVQDGLVNLRKLRGRADPKILPLVDAMTDFIQTVNAVNTGRRPPEALEPKRQAVLNALTKQQADRALMEKMLREGI